MPDYEIEKTTKPEERAYEVFNDLIESISNYNNQYTQYGTVDDNLFHQLNNNYMSLRLIVGNITHKDYPIRLPSHPDTIQEIVFSFIDDLRDKDFYTIGKHRAEGKCVCVQH